MSAPETRGSDPGLRERLHQAADAAAPRPIDVDAVLAASRARRRARRTAALGVTATAAVLLAAGGIAIAVNGLGPDAASNSALTSESAGTAPEAGPEGAGDDAAGTRLAAPEQVNLCGAPVAGATDASASGLVVAVEPPAAIAPGATVDVRVTVTNAGPSPVTGELRAAPALTVAHDGITRWHTNGVVSDESVPIALEPGASVELEGPATAVACSDADEPGEAFAEGLPALAPGEYAMSAIVMFTDAQTGAIAYLVAPLAPFALG
jgi:hypothetical protein